MRLLAELLHPGLPAAPKVLLRRAARGIVLRGERILLLHTERYDDFSLPGGGVDEHEDICTGLCREMEEETGAKNVRVLSSFGRIDEHRPHSRHPDFNTLFMQSFVYHCEIDDELGAARMEHYEVANGMNALWVNIHEALEHNRDVMSRAPSSMGQSIPRETLLLERIASEMVY